MRRPSSRQTTTSKLGRRTAHDDRHELPRTSTRSASLTSPLNPVRREGVLFSEDNPASGQFADERPTPRPISVAPRRRNPTASPNSLAAASRMRFHAGRQTVQTLLSSNPARQSNVTEL
ncbi:hypothetical protein C8039_12035 [Halogeometricum sp. wsp3]|nr:hypothetical protein C8039_12035 [Halogeometricum sp. wsp3]